MLSTSQAIANMKRTARDYQLELRSRGQIGSFPHTITQQRLFIPWSIPHPSNCPLRTLNCCLRMFCHLTIVPMPCMGSCSLISTYYHMATFSPLLPWDNVGCMTNCTFWTASVYTDCVSYSCHTQDPTYK